MGTKRIVLIGGLVVTGLILICAGRGSADVYDFGKVNYQNLAGTPYETLSATVQVSILAGPRLTITKEQKRYRGGGPYTTAVISAVYGDTINYRLTIQNTNPLTSSVDTATNIYVTDTWTFVSAEQAGDSAIFYAATGPESSTGPNSTTTHWNGATSTITKLQYTIDGTTWLDASSATWLAQQNFDLAGVRWVIDNITGCAAGNPVPTVVIQFTVQIRD